MAGLAGTLLLKSIGMDWDSKADHDNSLQVAGVKELISQAMPILDGRPEKGQELEILGGAGLK